MSTHVRQFGHPWGTDPEHFHLIAPFERDPKKWLKANWIDRYSGKPYRITTRGNTGTRSAARVKSYGDVIEQYEFHPESKCADAEGNTCDKETVGLLQRRHVRIAHVKPIGKETNNLDDVKAHFVHSEESVYTEYPDPEHDEWETVVLPALKVTPVNDVLKIIPKKSRRMIMYARAGRRPHPKTQRLIAAALRTLGAL